MNDAILHAPFVRRVTKNLTAEEERLIAAAEMPEIRQISDELLIETRTKLQQNSKVMFQGVGIALVVMVVGLLLGATKYSAAVGITAIVFAIAAVIMHLRAKIDQTATMMELPLHHMESSMLGSYAVCYLPDGKYGLRVSGDNSYANTVIVTQYKHMTTWQAVFIRKGDAVLPSTLNLDQDTDTAAETAPFAEADAGDPAKTADASTQDTDEYDDNDEYDDDEYEEDETE